MSLRRVELDRTYHRRIAVTYPLSALAVILAVIILPPQVRMDRGKTVGFSGPLHILPEIDITPERREDTHLTAAPQTAPPVDFVVVNLDYAILPEADPVPEPSPPKPKKPDKEATPESSVMPDLMTAIHTTGLPVLAQSDYELIYMQRPVYPPEAIRRGIEGEVEIMLLVGRTGRVEQTYVVRPNRLPLLEAAATDAVARCLFRAHLVNGRPTAFWVKVPVEFRLVN